MTVPNPPVSILIEMLGNCCSDETWIRVDRAEWSWVRPCGRTVRVPAAHGTARETELRIGRTLRSRPVQRRETLARNSDCQQRYAADILSASHTSCVSLLAPLNTIPAFFFGLIKSNVGLLQELFDVI